MSLVTPSKVKMSLYLTGDDFVYIGRRCTMGGHNLKDSKWHNPYPAKQHGLDQCLTLYENYLQTKMIENNGQKYFLLYFLTELAGKRLACFCKPGDRCHADILIKLGRQYALWQ